MGRSVGCARDSISRVFFAIDTEVLFNFQLEVVEPIVENLEYKYSSVHHCDYWHDNEGHVIAQSRLVKFVLYEYCGACCLCVVPVAHETVHLACQWVGKTNWESCVPFVQMRPVATASNGETFYEKV